MAKPGFSLIELILVVAIIGGLAAALFVAIDPAQRINDSRNALRSTSSRSILDAIDTYSASLYQLPPSLTALDADTFYLVAKDSSSDGQEGNCPTLNADVLTVDISADVVPSYLASIPLDPVLVASSTNQYSSGYWIKRNQYNAVTVGSCHDNSTQSGTIAEAYTDISLFMNFENDAASNPYDLGIAATSKECTNGDTAATMATWNNGDPGVYVNGTAAKIGSYGFHVRGDVTNWEYLVLDISSADIISMAKGRLGFWAYWPTGGMDSKRLIKVSDGGVGYLEVHANAASDRMECYYNDGSTTVAVSAANASIAENAWYFIECEWNTTLGVGADYVTIYTTTNAGSTTSASATGTLTAPSWTKFYFGLFTNSTNYEAYYDNLMISSDPARDLKALRSTTACPR